MPKNVNRTSTRPRPPRRGGATVHHNRVFKEHGCARVGYRFDLPRNAIDLPRFIAEMKAEKDVPWTAVCNADRASLGYHMHVSGVLKDERVQLTLEYFPQSGRKEPGEREPFAETTMKWLGGFLADKSVRVDVSAVFRRPRGAWASRFNLPFRVTMRGAQVAIDGLAMSYQHDTLGRITANVDLIGTSIYAIVRARIQLDYENFDVTHDIPVLSDAAGVFMMEGRSATN